MLALVFLMRYYVSSETRANAFSLKSALEKSGVTYICHVFDWTIFSTHRTTRLSESVCHLRRASFLFFKAFSTKNA